MSTGTDLHMARRPPVPLGLSRAEAARQLGVIGANILPAATRPAMWRLLLRQVTHRFALLLWAAAGLAFLAGMPQLAVAIVVVVVVNGGFAFAQEYRADRAADRLRDLLPATASVRRDDVRLGRGMAAGEVDAGEQCLRHPIPRVGPNLE